MRLRCNGGPFYEGRDSLIRLGVSRGLEPVRAFEPLDNGWAAELLLVGPGLDGLVHARPVDRGTAEGAEVASRARVYGNGTETDPVFRVVFPHPGVYRALARVRVEGTTLTIPYTIEARREDGSPPPFGPFGPSHEHRHGAGGQRAGR